MPVYPSSPINRSVVQAVPEFPAYLLGSLNRTVAPTRGKIQNVSSTGGTATVQVLVTEGNIPVVGQLITIAGAVPSAFNVTGAAILTVSAPANPDVGVYTVTFALAGTVASTPSPGEFFAPQQEVGDSVTLGGAGTWFSIPAAIQSNTGPNDGRSLRADVNFPTLPTSATITLQTASICDTSNDNWVDLGTVASVTAGVQSGGSVVFADSQQNFVRFKISGTSGAGTVVGKILV